MMSTQTLKSAEQAAKYFDKTEEYYTQNLTNYDRWHGTLAETLGLQKEMSKEQFDAMLKSIEQTRRKDVGLDCTFSAPKSVSLALAKDDKTREDMIAAHQAAVKHMIDKIEVELCYTRKNGKSIATRNLIAGEFVHMTARPTKANNYIPDLDLHSHVVLANCTTVKGKNFAFDFKKILDGRNKELGLEYRRELAAELQKRGYELELTDARQGFFELSGFDRETILSYSHRSSEIREYAKANDLDVNSQSAKLDSRSAKSEAKEGFLDIIDATRADLFYSGKIVIKKSPEKDVQVEHSKDKSKGGIDNEKEHDKHRINGNPRAVSDALTRAGESGNRTPGEDEGQVDRDIDRGHSLSYLLGSDLDAAEGRTDLLLSDRQLTHLAKCQSAKIRSTFMQREESKERRGRIDKIARDVIKNLSRETYAFSIKECQRRIMAAGILENVSEGEAIKSMDRAGLVKLGRKDDDGGKDVFLTTVSNFQIEKSVMERVRNGKGKVKKNIFDLERSQKALVKAEKIVRARGKDKDFSIADGEQGAAIHHLLTSPDKYVAWDGLAGTGKTTAMERLNEICKAENITIRGVCFTGKAADGLEADSGIESQTIHSFLNKLEAGKYNDSSMDTLKKAAKDLAKETFHIHSEKPVPERHGKDALFAGARELAAESLLGDFSGRAKKEIEQQNRQESYERQRQEKADKGIKQEWDFSRVSKAECREIWAVDEAGLVDMHLMNQLQKAAEARGAQVLLLGDPDQLPPVGAGEPMRQMEEAGMATAHLVDIRRQKNQELLEAVKESVKGNHLLTFEKLDKSGDYREIADKTARREAVVAEMTGANIDDYKSNLLLVSTNADRRTYNKAIREIYVERGELEKGKKFEITVNDGEKERNESRHFDEKDRIIFLANDNKLGVKNGTMASIERMEGDIITAKTDAGKQITWNMCNYNKIDHGYAVTNYKAQGMTVDKVVADMNTKGNPQTRNALYVDISRARKKAVVYTDDKAKLERQTRDFAWKITSRDFAKKTAELSQRGILSQDLYKAPERNLKEREAKMLAEIRENALRQEKEKPIKEKEPLKTKEAEGYSCSR